MLMLLQFQDTEVLLRPFLAAFHFLSPASHTRMLPAVFTGAPGQAEVEDCFFFFYSSTIQALFSFFGFRSTLSYTEEPLEHVYYNSNFLDRVISLYKRRLLFISSARKKHHIHMQLLQEQKFLLKPFVTAERSHIIPYILKQFIYTTNQLTVERSMLLFKTGLYQVSWLKKIDKNVYDAKFNYETLYCIDCRQVEEDGKVFLTLVKKTVKKKLIANEISQSL